MGGSGSQQLSSFRDLIGDEEKIFVVLARVTLHDGETSHWYKTTEGHIAVRCKTHRHQIPIDALLPSTGGEAYGLWTIPDLETEVAIGFDFGDVEGDAFVIGIYGNSSPTDINTGKIVAVTELLEVIKPGGTAESLALVRDVQAQIDFLKKQFDTASGHTHASNGAPPSSGSGSGTGFTITDAVGTGNLKAQGADS